MCDTRPEVAGADRVLGMYLNTVPFPFTPRVSTWGDLVRNVFSTEIDLWPHRRYPIGNIQRDNGGLRPAEVCFGYLDFHSIDETLIETASGIDDSPSEFRLSVMAQQNNVLSLDCWPQDISPENLDRLGEVYLAVLTAMATDPDGDAHGASLSQEGRAALEELLRHAVEGARAPHEADQDRASDPIAPRNPVERRLHRVFEQILKTEPIGVHDDFFAKGGDSLLAVRALTAIERQFGVLPPMAALLERPTIASLATVITDPAATKPRPLVRLSDRRGTPLFCVHPIGGSASCYTRLARELADDAYVYGIQAIGLDLGQQRYTDLESMAGSYVEAMRDASHEPWRLVGWSLGALIAHEMARQLEAAGETVDLLALLDPSPLYDARAPQLDELDVMARFQENLGAHEMVDHEALAAVQATERRAVLLDRLRAPDRIPADADEDGLQRALDGLIGNWRAYTAHRPQPIRGGAHLFYSDGAAASDSVRIWSELCQGGLVATHIPGGHDAALSASQVLDLLRSACRKALNTDNER